MGVVALATLAGGAPDGGADRSRVVLDLHCGSQVGHEQLTLFANGTVRLRHGVGEVPIMRLGELTPDQVRAYVNRLRAEDLSEVDDDRMTMDGEWVEHCSLELTLEGRPQRHLTFGRYDTLPLPLSRLLRIADDLRQEVPVTVPSRLPMGYEPRIGDLLRRVDGEIFEVVAFTSDGEGVELQGVEQPITLYAGKHELSAQFLELVTDAAGP